MRTIESFIHVQEKQGSIRSKNESTRDWKGTIWLPIKLSTRGKGEALKERMKGYQDLLGLARIQGAKGPR